MPATQEVLWEMDWSEVPAAPPVRPPAVPRVAEVAGLPLPLPPVAPAPVATPPVSLPPVVAPAATPAPAVALVKGQRVDLARLEIRGASFEVGFQLKPPTPAIQLLCAGLGAADRVPSKEYLLYSNRLQSPCGGLVLSRTASGEDALELDTALLPASIQRVLIAVAVSGTGVLAASLGSLRIGQNGNASARYEFSGTDADGSASVLLAELYLRQGSWRLYVRSEGYAGGQEAFIRQYGRSLQ